MRIQKHYYHILTLIVICLFGGIINTYFAFAENTTDFNVNISTVLGLSITQPDTVDIDSTSFNTLKSSDIVADVTTNNITGYTLTMSSDSTDLATQSGSTISTLDDTVSANDFTVNRWGISYDDGASYVPFTTQHQFAPTTGPANHSYTNLKAGVKLDITTAAGMYANTINFLAVVNPTSFTVTWNPNGGTVSPNTSIYGYGSALGELPAPTYDGYDFLGWFTQAEGGEEVTSETTITNDATYYAQWARSLISFRICAPGCTIYRAEEGMTWADFVDSSYNTLELTHRSGIVCRSNLCLPMSSDTTIAPNMTYIFEPVRPLGIVVVNEKSAERYEYAINEEMPWALFMEYERDFIEEKEGIFFKINGCYILDFDHRLIFSDSIVAPGDEYLCGEPY